MSKENQAVEFKESWRDDYLRWVCGFANSHGGTLIIGKNDR
ncbi:MAG: ATP-binding protein, partial [Thermotogaceae bacterium]|nr:ATP-binding protein [Thermotogaceae bacterium]